MGETDEERPAATVLTFGGTLLEAADRAPHDGNLALSLQDAIRVFRVLEDVTAAEHLPDPCDRWVRVVGHYLDWFWGCVVVMHLADPDGGPWPAERLRKLRLAVERRGVLVSDVADSHCVMLMPPLVSTDEDLKEMVAALDDALADGVGT